MTGSCEYAYTFLCSNTLSGDNRNPPAGRKPKRVNEALRSVHQVVEVAFCYLSVTTERYQKDHLLLCETVCRSPTGRNYSRTEETAFNSQPGSRLPGLDILFIPLVPTRQIAAILPQTGYRSFPSTTFQSPIY
jgi:hypothetical protein